jgi:hypothetical protein
LFLVFIAQAGVKKASVLGGTTTFRPGPLLAGDVRALRLAVPFGAIRALISSISSGVFFGIGGLGARGRQGQCRRSGQPEIRAGQFHAAKLTFCIQTNNPEPLNNHQAGGPRSPDYSAEKDQLPNPEPPGKT